MTPSSTLFDKLWREHCILSEESGEDLLLIDRILLHERTGAVALEALREKDRGVKTPSHAFCTMDHIVSNRPGRTRNEARSPGGDVFISSTRDSAARSGVTLVDIDDPRQGIVHVMAPELGIVQPGVSIVCPDSHTCSLGAFGALAWGIGSSAAEHALATQTLKLKKPANMRVTLEGELQPGVYPKDIVLALIAWIGAGAAANHAVEFAGEAVRRMSMEGRMTLCNMAVEFAAFTALIAPDKKAVDYLADREYAPKGEALEDAKTWWRALASDEDAEFDKDVVLDVGSLEPQVSWGTSPEQSGGIGATLLDPGALPAEKRESAQNALAYMDLKPGQRLEGAPIDGAFIGSCTNGRIEDLREAASVLKGGKVSPKVKAVCVPGSQAVKRQAEEEGLAEIFTRSGFEWGEPGCGYCFYAGGETFAPGARVVSSTNRNFEGRQGPSVRTHLCSPATVAASALAGAIADPRPGSGEAQAMKPFTTHKGVAAPLLRDNIDTDQIIPSREMKTVGKTGLAGGLFAGWRYQSPDSRDLNPDFVLNQPAYQNASILVAGANFGCGSSREHAVWALAEYGIRAVVAESFGSIFRSNAIRNGVLPVSLRRETIEWLAERLKDPGAKSNIQIDLNRCVLSMNGDDDALIMPFQLADAEREMLLNGYDPVDLTEKHASEIEAFIRDHRAKRPWIYRDKT